MVIPKVNLQLWAIVGLAFIIGLGAGTFFGNKYGRAIINNDWSNEKVETANAGAKQSEGNREAEAQHAKSSNEVADNAQVSKTQYDADIASITSDADDRVRESETRASKYRAMSEASAAEQKRLAEYATRLDQALTEGRQLVKELRATLAERERTIHNLSNQIQADRKLTDEH